MRTLVPTISRDAEAVLPALRVDFQKDAAPNLIVEQERELQFVARLSDLRASIALEKLPGTEIHQRYFLKEDVSSVVRAICDRKGIRHQALRDLHFTSARTRVVIHGGDAKYFIQAKGPKTKEAGVHIVRPEISAEVSHKEYQRFVALTASGSVHKTRSLISGAVDHHRLGRVILIGEIDVFHSFGDSKSSISASQRHDFARIDIEIPHQKLAKSIRRGQHTFAFLKECAAVELGACDKEIRKAFSTRRMALSGIDRRFTRAWQTLQTELARRAAV